MKYLQARFRRFFLQISLSLSLFLCLLEEQFTSRGNFYRGSRPEKFIVSQLAIFRENIADE